MHILARNISLKFGTSVNNRIVNETEKNIGMGPSYKIRSWI